MYIYSRAYAIPPTPSWGARGHRWGDITIDAMHTFNIDPPVLLCHEELKRTGDEELQRKREGACFETPSWGAFRALLGSLGGFLGSLGAAVERPLRESGGCLWGSWRPLGG